MTESTQTPEKEFFISYTGKDRPWAEWIGWILEEAGHSVFIDVWDFRAGTNFALEMQKGTQCKQTIAVLSESYLKAAYTAPEWAAAFAEDPNGESRRLIPVRVEDFDPPGLLKAIVYVNFVGISETEAEARLLRALKPRGKPDTRPSFPGTAAISADTRSVPQKVTFPGTIDALDTPSDGAASASTGDSADPKTSDPEAKNPFWPRTGVVEEAAQFFNCEGTLRRIFESLNGGSSVAIIGEPNMGKSSLLRAVHRMAAEYLTLPRHPVWLNLARIFSEQDFYEDLCQELGMEPVDGNRFVRAMYRQEKQFLLLLDEVEQINQEGFTYKIRQILRGLAEGNDAPLRLVITARTSLDKLFSESYVDGQTSPLEGLCVEEHIQPWPAETSRQFIAKCLANGPIQFTEIEIEQRVQACNGCPQKLMQTCHQLYNHYREVL